MKLALSLILLLAFSPIVFSQESISEEITNQTSEFFHRFSNSPDRKQVVTATELAKSSSITSIVGEIQPYQICISLGEFSSSPNWSLASNGSSITYTGEINQELDFFVMCESANKIKTAIKFFPSDKIQQDYVSHCQQLREDNTNVACVVVLTESVPMSTGEDFSVAYQLFFVFALFVIFPLIFIFKAENVNIKLFDLIKTFLLVAVFVVFYFLGFFLSVLTTVILLFFFFIQINLSVAPLILGLHSGESFTIKIMLKFVLVMELFGLVVSLFLISPFL